MGQISLKSAIGSGGGVELGELIWLNSAKPVFTSGVEEYLISGAISTGDAATYPEAYANFSYVGNSPNVARSTPMYASGCKMGDTGTMLYVVNAASGVKSYRRSTNNGLTWTDLTVGGAVANLGPFYPVGGTTWVNLGSSGYLYWSTDDGLTWSSKAAGITLRTATYGNGVIIVGGQQGFVRSTDNGTTWTTISVGQYTMYDVCYVPGDNSFVAFELGGIIWKSTNNGLTWVNKANTNNVYADTRVSANGSTVVFSDGTNVRISYNSGETWAVLNQQVGNVAAGCFIGNLFYNGSSKVTVDFNNWYDAPAYGSDQSAGNFNNSMFYNAVQKKMGLMTAKSTTYGLYISDTSRDCIGVPLISTKGSLNLYMRIK